MKTVEDKLIAYIENQLTEKERLEIEKQLESNTQWQQVYRELQELLTNLETLPTLEMEVAAQHQFYEFLAKEQTKQQRGIIPLFGKYLMLTRIAAAILLLITGFWIGLFFTQQGELKSLKAEMASTKQLLILSMLEQPSASQRIQAINYSLDDENQSLTIANALINTLNNDENINVRMKAVEGLSVYQKHEKVRHALLKALKTQKSPEVQLTLIEILVMLEDEKAILQFQEILNQEEIDETVKNQAAEGLKLLL